MTDDSQYLYPCGMPAEVYSKQYAGSSQSRYGRTIGGQDCSRSAELELPAIDVVVSERFGGLGCFVLGSGADTDGTDIGLLWLGMGAEESAEPGHGALEPVVVYIRPGFGVDLDSLGLASGCSRTGAEGSLGAGLVGDMGPNCPVAAYCF